MKRTYGIVRDFAEERKLDFRTASYSIGARPHREGVLRARHLPVAFALPATSALLLLHSIPDALRPRGA